MGTIHKVKSFSIGEPVGNGYYAYTEEIFDLIKKALVSGPLYIPSAEKIDEIKTIKSRYIIGECTEAYLVDKDVVLSVEIYGSAGFDVENYVMRPIVVYATQKPLTSKFYNPVSVEGFYIQAINKAKPAKRKRERKSAVTRNKKMSWETVCALIGFLELLEMEFHVEVVVKQGAMNKIIDNERDARLTIDRLCKKHTENCKKGE